MEKYLILAPELAIILVNNKTSNKMKRILLFVIAACMISLLPEVANAQNQRMLMFECFTNTSCGPCASQNPALDALINANPNTVAAIKYHMNWPGANDPMYMHNPTDNNARKSVYAVNAVPHTVVDGIRFGDVPSGLTQSAVNTWAAIPSPFRMRMTTELNASQDTITVNIMGMADAAVSGAPKLMVGVIEKEIHYTSAPGSNGEKDFYSVMKKLLPTSGGTPLGSMEAGDYFAYSFKWALANVYNNDQLSAVAWIQDQTTKEVYQACKASDEITPFFSNEGGVSDITNVKSLNCSGIVQPYVMLSNFGAQTLTSATIEVSVNGVTAKTINWTGSLTAFKSEKVNLGEINFDVLEDNEITVNLTTVNGGQDEAMGNNTTTLSFDGSPANVGTVIKLTIRTDNNPQETTWEVKSMTTGAVVLSGGPYTTANTMINETLAIPGDDCYDFTIYDAGGDGLTDGNGLYGMRSGNMTLFSGGAFTYSESNEFSYEVSLNTAEQTVTSCDIYPNPTENIVNIEAAGENQISIYNATGQLVYSAAMKDSAIIDMRQYGAGIYMIRTTGDAGSVSSRIIVL